MHCTDSEMKKANKFPGPSSRKLVTKNILPLFELQTLVTKQGNQSHKIPWTKKLCCHFGVITTEFSD